MRITISHDKGQAEAMRRIDRTAGELLRSSIAGPVRLMNFKKHWKENTLYFSVTGAMGPLSQDVSGTIEVTERDVICEITLPAFLVRLLGAQKVEETVQGRVKGLLAG